MNKLVCITGLTGAGKSVASDFFVEKGYIFFRFGQVVLDEVKRHKLEPIESNEKPIREVFRKIHGMAAMAILNLPKIKRLIIKGNVLGNGLYSFEEYKVLQNEFGDIFKVVSIYAPPYMRYERLEKRLLEKSDKDLRNRPATRDAANKRDVAELENLNKGATIAMADYTIVNTKSLKDFYVKLKELYDEI